MNITRTKSFFRMRCKPGVHIQTWLLFLFVIMLTGCKTVPIQDRNFAENSGFWEQDENMGFRLHHNASASNAVIGTLYAAGKSVLLNGDRVKISAPVKNNAFISAGMQSGARIEFKASDSTCLIRIDRFNAGNAYGDTSSCLHDIETLHARIQAKNAVLQISVSQQQTDVMVLSGSIEVMPREDTGQFVVVQADQKITVTPDAVGKPHALGPDEIWQRMRWRGDFHLYKTVVDWNKVVAGVGVVAFVAAAILFGKGRGGGGHGRGIPRYR
ncbi:hypothetical protein ABF87_06150 [Nitrosomonas sp. JL21]|uniref:hypothetical protein n=1 Tax=Nitrosomonas sp. JL21 TaxID=153949 RepID=UPI00137117FE|nr:hypothetical protein [Nitrosomonas sp. JL21]MBL8498334.1 hypothetical protein [Nitrosomonas sp.]MCC7090449.1 hypothetical protein [Nitrosomonas sp.]MXS77551.1 hypothetical protein [Nitrosomonas sp. JL21]